MCIPGQQGVTVASTASPDPFATSLLNYPSVTRHCLPQTTRMLSFGHDLCLVLSALDGTAARIGLATGPIVLTHIAHGGDVLPAKYIYGDTVRRPPSSLLAV